MYLSAYVVYYLVSWRLARRFGLPTRVWIIAGICFSMGGVFGAKLLYDLQQPAFGWQRRGRLRQINQPLP